MRHLTYKISATLTALMPSIAFANQHPQDVGVTEEGIIGILDTVAGSMFVIFIALAIVIFLYAAFLYLTAGGNSENVGKAKTALIYGVVAIVVAVVAGGLPGAVCDIIGTTTVCGTTP